MKLGLFNPFFTGNYSNPYYYTQEGEALPTDIPNLKFWYDISQLTGLVDGNKIPTLVDYSGNGIDITNAVDASRGVYKENIQNGKPALQCANANHYVGVKADWNWMHQGDNTLFLVWGTTVDNATGTLFDSAGGTATSLIGRGILTFTLARLQDECYAAGAAGEYVHRAQSISNSFPKNTIVVTVHRYEEGKTGDDFTIDKNGNLFISNQGVLSPSVSDSSQLPVWFRRSNLFNNGFSGNFLEGFGYDRALTTTEISRLLGTLTTSYGL